MSELSKISEIISSRTYNYKGKKLKIKPMKDSHHGDCVKHISKIEDYGDFIWRAYQNNNSWSKTLVVGVYAITIDVAYFNTEGFCSNDYTQRVSVGLMYNNTYTNIFKSIEVHSDITTTESYKELGGCMVNAVDQPSLGMVTKRREKRYRKNYSDRYYLTDLFLDIKDELDEYISKENRKEIMKDLKDFGI